MQEREIDLVDLLVDILLHWRMIIVWMLAGGILMGAFSYVRSNQAVADQRAEIERKEMAKKDIQKILQQQEEILTANQKNNVRAVLNYEEFIEINNQSLLMQIDAANVPKTELVFWVKASTVEQSYNIEKLYEELVSSGMGQWLADKGEKAVAAEVNELITVGQETNQLHSSDLSLSLSVVGSDSFNISIIGVDREQCTQMAQSVIEYVQSLQELVNQQEGNHEVVLMNQSFNYCVDHEILNRQRTMVANGVADAANAEEIRKDFSTGEQTYYELLKIEQASAEEDAVTGEDIAAEEVASELAPSISIKYVFLGIVLFAFLYIFYSFLQYTFNNKLRAADDVKVLYNLSLLGEIPQSTGKKKALSFIDGWILKLRNRNKRSFSEEEATGLAAVAVKITTQKENLTEVYCIGCDVKGRALAIAEKLQSTLKEDNITLTILNNVLYDQEALERLSSAKCVFLLEQAGVTLYDEIVKELELLQRQEIKVIGAVVVE